MSNLAVDVAPDVPLVDEAGRAVTLSTLLAADRTILFFLRASSCPACIGHSRKLVAAQAEGRIRVPVILVTPGGAGEAAAVARRVRPHPGVTVVASGDAHDLIGLPKRLLMQHSGTFVVTPDRRIRYARTAMIPTGAYSERDLLQALADTKPSAV